jgi:hypothetical protein
MNIPRRDPLTLEQALIHCPGCSELLAVIESLGPTYTAVYLWRPVGDSPGPRCHEKGLTAWQAEAAFLSNGCDDHRSEIIDTYGWGPREWQPIPQNDHPDEPYLDPVDEQLELTL